jgi:hypothetical protein
VIAPLFHFTCEHAAEKIGTRGYLRPFPQPVLGGRALVWLTDLAVPDVEGLGLTSVTLSCDRTEFRYEVVDPKRALPWRVWWLGSGVPVPAAIALERCRPGLTPERWWVSTVPILAVRLPKGEPR